MDRLDSYFKAYNKVDENTGHSVFYMESKDLINPRRIDIIAKHYYIKARETGENLELAKEIYKKHIEAFSDGTFSEQGNSEKDSIEKYFQVFDRLINDFKIRGFDEELSIIPVGKNNEILDGSHRAACAIYFKEKVKVIKFNNLAVDYGFEFFKKRLLDDFYLDFIAKEYVNLDKNVYAMFVWPKIGTSENTNHIEDSLKEDGLDVLYKKKIKLEKQEFWNLIFNTYKNEYKAGNFPNKLKDGYLHVYILNNLNTSSFKQKKKASRENFKLLDSVLDKDYDNILYENFLNSKDGNYTSSKDIRRKARYVYRTILNKVKHIIGKPV